MTRPTPYQHTLVKQALTVINRAAERCSEDHVQEVTLQILEAAAARIGGYDVDWYWDVQKIRPIRRALVEITSGHVVQELGRLKLHPSISLAALAAPNSFEIARRRSGSYFTDFRLANYLAKNVAANQLNGLPIIDPACGSGILLVATILHLTQHDRSKTANLLKSKTFGVDKNPYAVRTAALSLSSLTSDQTVISSLLRHLWVCDSLLESEKLKAAVAPKGFGAVITNPPWEKIKITRHEYLSANGAFRHYGDDYAPDLDHDGYAREKLKAQEYVRLLSKRYDLMVGKEVDLYAVFLELCVNLVVGHGQIAAIIPAGLIRSHGTEKLRKRLFQNCESAKISLFENKARFFDIDTRFKFLTLVGLKASRPTECSISFYHPGVNGHEIVENKDVSFSRRALSKLRSDFSIPEVRTRNEWRIFQRLTKQHSPLSEWGRRQEMDIRREVDMTRDRQLFSRNQTAGGIPLIEGRMVHQYTSNAKGYVGGTGRRANWIANEGAPCLQPQYWVNPNELPNHVAERLQTCRIGFCDITGQTNERSMLAALVPENVVCGNKVPTITFKSSKHNFENYFLFLSIINSFVFDWLLRRVFTTTVNYFILKSIPFPAVNVQSPLAARLAQLAERLSLSPLPFGHWELAETRAEIEARVARAFGITLTEFVRIMGDFPLLDRNEPTILGESRSTITRDFTLYHYARLLGESSSDVKTWEKRIAESKNRGAIPFRPTHLTTIAISQGVGVKLGRK